MNDASSNRDGILGSLLHKYISLGAVVTIGIVLSILVFAVARNRADRQLTEDFERATQERISVLENRLKDSFQALDWIAAFFDGSQKVERDEFRSFVEHHLEYTQQGSRFQSAIQALEWIPRVPDSQRQMYETVARNEGFGNFQISERETQGLIVKAVQRDEYYPVYFVEPYKGNEISLGFDLGSDPARLEALRRSRDTGAKVATAPITLVQETGEQQGFLVFKPIYRKGAPIESIEDRRERLEGFATGVFKVGDVLDNALMHLEAEGIDMHIYDATVPTYRPLMAFRPSRTRDRPNKPMAYGEVEQLKNLHVRAAIDVGGRKWQILCTPAPAFITVRKTWQGWILFVGSLAFTGLLATYLQLMHSHVRKTKEHSAELLRGKEELEKEVAHRRQAEEEISDLAKFPSENPNPVLRISKDYTIVYANDATLPLLETLQCGPGERLSDSWRERVREAFGSGAVSRFEFECEGRTFLVTLAPVQGVDYVNAYGLDITDRKQAEREKTELELHLRQTQKMEAVGTLAGGIAHDFNNILGALIGYLDMVLEDTPEDAATRYNLEHASVCCERARDLVKQILTFSRKTEEQRKPLQIGPIVEETLELLRSSLPTTIEIHRDIDVSSGVAVANATQIHQVLVNLCTNAGHAMEENGGVLEVRLTEVDFESDTWIDTKRLKQGSYLRLSVSDTGQGIDSNVMKRIFEPFFTTKGVGKGTGMGLSVVHGIVEDHGGKITVRSTPGEGTTFNVFLPRAVSDGQEKHRSSPSSVLGGTETILLIDDEDAIIDVMKQMLERLGYTVVDEDNGITALETFGAEPAQFDLVITDQTMPKMTGLQLAEELMKIRADIPIILCTGYSEQIGAAEAKSIGIREFVMKPVVKEKMAAIIRNVLNKEEANV